MPLEMGVPKNRWLIVICLVICVTSVIETASSSSYNPSPKNNEEDLFYLYDDSFLSKDDSTHSMATPRKLIVDDGVDENVREKRSNSRSSFEWRLKDLSMLESLFDLEESTEDFETSFAAKDTTIGSFDLKLDLHEHPSDLYEVRIQPPKSSNLQPYECLENNGKCLFNDTMSLREKLQKDLEISYSDPLSSRIEYRLKRKPSIYSSKKPQTRSDIGIPDIYEMEVEVTPVKHGQVLPKQQQQHQQQHNNNNSKITRTPLGKANHNKFVSLSNSPKFVSLGSLYNSRKGSSGTAPPKNPTEQRSVPPPRKQLQRGNLRPQSNPRASGIKKILPYRRPTSYKFKRDGSIKKNGYTLDEPGNQTKQLSILEKITLNKTPGIVIEPSKRFEQSVSPYLIRGNARDRRPMRFRPGKRRRKNKKKQNSFSVYKAPIEHSSHFLNMHSTGYESPSVTLQIPTNEYLPPKRSKTKGSEINKVKPTDSYDLPNQNGEPKSKYENTDKSTGYLSKVYTETLTPDKPSNSYETPNDSSDTYQTPNDPSNTYQTPKKISNTYQAPSQLYDLPSNEYLPPQKDSSESYNLKSPNVNYNLPTNEYILPTSQTIIESNEAPKRGKGQIPGWLMTLKNERVHPTPPPDYLPVTTQKWVPVKPEHDIGPMFIMPKDMYSSPHTIGHIRSQQKYNNAQNKLPSPIQTYKPPENEYLPPHKDIQVYSKHMEENYESSYESPPQSYDSPSKEYNIPMNNNPIEEYVPPFNASPVSVSTYNDASKEYQSEGNPRPPQIHTPIDISILSSEEDYLPPSSYKPPSISTPLSKTYSTSISKPENKYKDPIDQIYGSPETTTYSTPIYTPTSSVSGINDLLASKFNSKRPSKGQPQVIFINDQEYEYYIDDYDYDDHYEDEDADLEYYDYYEDDYYDNMYYSDYEFEVLPTPKRPFMPHILMSNMDEVIHEVDIMQYGYILGIPGIAGRDYPILQYIPLTTFRCHLVADYPGYYADMEAGCQVFHVCHRDGRQDSFLCPNGTVFNQKYFVCDWWYNFSCEDAAFFYPVNAAIEYQEVPVQEGTPGGQTTLSHSAQAGSYSKFTSSDRQRRKTKRRGSEGRRRLRGRPSKRKPQLRHSLSN